MEMIEGRDLLYFFLLVLEIPIIFILTKVGLNYEPIREFIIKNSNRYSFQLDGYEEQSYFIFHPNGICYFRIFLIWSSFFLYLNGFFWGGVNLFFLAAATDFVDGMVARKCQLETSWGKILDPLCDKIFYFPYFFYFAYKGFFPVYVVIIFLIWDLGIGQFVARNILIHYGLSPKSKIFGKTKTVICTACLAVCFAFDLLQTQTIRYGVEILITVLFYISLALSVLSVHEKLKGLLKKMHKTKKVAAFNCAK